MQGHAGAGTRQGLGRTAGVTLLLLFTGFAGLPSVEAISARDGQVGEFSTGAPGLVVGVGPGDTGNASFMLPLNSTVLSAQLVVSVHGDDRPGSLRMDVASDGIPEFASSARVRGPRPPA